MNFEVEREVVQIAFEGTDGTRLTWDDMIDKNYIKLSSNGTAVKYGSNQTGLQSLDGKLNIPEGISTIKLGAFYGCRKLKNISIPNSVKTIESDTFYNCSNLESVLLPAGLTEIGGNAFRGCSTLTTITIPNSVTNIGYYAFSACDNLTEIHYSGTAVDDGTHWGASSATIIKD